MTANLKNAVKEEEEKWTGKVTVTRTEDKVKSTWTLTPALVFDDEGLSGSVGLQKKEGSKNTVKAAFDVKAGPYQGAIPPAAASAKDLRDASPERARAMVQEEIAPLTAALAELMESLTDKERASLLHDLRTDAWMNGPVTPALEAAVEELEESEEPEEPEESEEPEDEWDEEGDE